MTILEGKGWKLRWGLYWTWPHMIDREIAKFRSYYFGPLVFEISYEVMLAITDGWK